MKDLNYMVNILFCVWVGVECLSGVVCAYTVLVLSAECYEFVLADAGVR